MFSLYFITAFLLFNSPDLRSEYSLPIDSPNRKSISELYLTGIGEFGVIRRARPNIPEHYHTGIDIKRPSNNYSDEAIFPIYEGVVISKRVDGAYAQLIIEHQDETKFWTVYEHIAGISVDLFDEVDPYTPIARFMNTEELNKYGWQFDHFHFEILKKEPEPLKSKANNPQRLFSSYSLTCYTPEDLNTYFYAPLHFLGNKLQANP